MIQKINYSLNKLIFYLSNGKLIRTNLKNWRKIKALSLGIQPELFLSTLTLKHFCKSYPDRNKMSMVKGLSKRVWDKYHSEIGHWLENSDEE